MFYHSGRASRQFWCYFKTFHQICTFLLKFLTLGLIFRDLSLQIRGCFCPLTEQAAEFCVSLNICDLVLRKTNVQKRHFSPFIFHKPLLVCLSFSLNFISEILNRNRLVLILCLYASRFVSTKCINSRALRHGCRALHSSIKRCLEIIFEHKIRR